MTSRKAILAQVNTVPSLPSVVLELRKYLNDYNPTEAMEFLIDKLSKTKSNEQFLGAMNT